MAPLGSVSPFNCSSPFLFPESFSTKEWKPKENHLPQRLVSSCAGGGRGARPGLGSLRPQALEPPARHPGLGHGTPRTGGGRRAVGGAHTALRSPSAGTLTHTQSHSHTLTACEPRTQCPQPLGRAGCPVEGPRQPGAFCRLPAERRRPWAPTSCPVHPWPLLSAPPGAQGQGPVRPTAAAPRRVGPGSHVGPPEWLYRRWAGMGSQAPRPGAAPLTWWR